MTFPVLYFAAGLGTRMGNLTRARPKPLIDVSGKALIDHAMQYGDQAGLWPQVVNLHYLPEMITRHLDQRPVLFSDESDSLLETGGGLRKALPLLGPGPVMTMNTDAVWGSANPFTCLIDAWDESKMDGLLLMIDPALARGHLGQGDFVLDDQGRARRGPGMIYAGVQIIKPGILDDISDTQFSLNIVWDRLGEQGRLFGVRYPDLWCDVGRPESIPIAEAMLNECHGL